MKNNTIWNENKGIYKTAMMTICFLILSKFGYSQNIADFSGKWNFNKSKSSSALSNITSSSIIISQEENRVITLNITITSGNSRPFNEIKKYVLNTALQSKTITPEEKSKRIDCVPAPDGQSFSITETNFWVENGISKKSISVSVYTLSKDGKTLIVKTDDTLPASSPAPANEKHEIRVYDKSI